MSEEKGTRWLCHRCAKKEGVQLDPDPVDIRVCDGCKIENHTRPVSGAVAVEVVKEAEKPAELVVEAEPEPEPEPEPVDPKKAEIEQLKAQIAELEK